MFEDEEPVLIKKIEHHEKTENEITPVFGRIRTSSESVFNESETSRAYGSTPEEETIERPRPRKDRTTCVQMLLR